VSLRTKNASVARRIGAWVNARLESTASMTERRDLLINIRTWTAEGLTVNGEDDQQNFQKFYDRNPEFKEAWLERIRKGGEAREAYAMSRENSEVLDRMRAMNKRMDSQRVQNPTRASDAISNFVSSKSSAAENTKRTLDDKTRLLVTLLKHLAVAYPDLGDDPLIDQIQTFHIDSFCSSAQVRKHRDDVGILGGAVPIAPSTALKKMSDLRSFFSHVHRVQLATLEDPTSGLENQIASLRAKKSRQKKSYGPFDDDHLRRIFDPKTYLAFNRAADYFWAPLIGLHTGLRLGEIVTLRLNDIQQNSKTGIWSLGVVDENSKNGNSIRRVPVSTRLMKLGFIRYVRHVRALGATVLFPHRDMTKDTFQSDPSKRCSQNFGEYLETIGISDPQLVFHSFRHNVVSALQDGNTPMSESMSIVGHAAQEHALLTGKVTNQHASSVHTGTYNHPDSPRMNVADPLGRMKGHLDRCVTPPLNYRVLRIAASIVEAHTLKSSCNYKTGWSKLRKGHTRDQLLKLK
jgi:integrase